MLERIRFEITALNKTRQAFASTRRGLDTVRRSVLNVRNALLALGAGVGVSRSVSQIDALAKSASKLGLAVETLQELRFAAEQSGVAVNTFDMAFQRFTRRAAEAAQGTGEARDALKQLKIELRDAEGNLRPTEDLFEDVADALMRVKDPADQVRLAFKLFDSEGVSLINMLKEGSAGIEDLRGQFRDLGVQLTGEQVAAVVSLKDEWNKLWTTLKGIGNQIVATFAPAFEVLARFLNDTAAGLFRFTRELFENAKVLAQWLGLLKGPIAAQIAQTNEKLGQLFADRKNASSDYETGLINERIAALLRARTALIAQKDALNTPALTPPSLTPPSLNLGGGASISPAMEAISHMYDPARLGLDNVKDAAKGLAVVLKVEVGNALGAVEDAFVNMAMTGKASFSTLANSIISDLFRMQARMLSSGLMSVFTNLAGSLIGGSAAPMTSPLPIPAPGSGVGFPTGPMPIPRPNALGNIFSAGNVIPFARGGVVNRPTLFPMATGAGLMGEAGPEAILPLKRGRGGRLGVESSGGGTVVNVYAPEGSSVQEERSQFGGTEQIDIYIDQATARNLSRQGSATHRSMKAVFGGQQQLIAR